MSAPDTAPTPLDHGIAGLSGNIASCLLLYPIDQARAVQQSASAPRGAKGRTLAIVRSMLQEGGVQRLYAGLDATLLAIGTSSISYTWLYELARSKLLARLGRSLRVGENLLVAFLAGVISAFITSPLWVASTRMRLQQRRTLKKELSSSDDTDSSSTTPEEEPMRVSPSPTPSSSFFSGFHRIVGKQTTSSQADLDSVDGRLENQKLLTAMRAPSHVVVRSPPSSPPSQKVHYNSVLHALVHVCQKGDAWSGMASSVLLCTNPAIQYASYEFLRQRVLKGRVAIDPISGFAYGAIAKALATLLTYPLQVVQTRMREPGAQGNLLTATLAIWERNGLQGFFSGLETKLFHTVLNSALIFAVYESLLEFVVRTRSRMSLGRIPLAMLTAIVAAIVGAKLHAAARPIMFSKGVQMPPEPAAQAGSGTTTDLPPRSTRPRSP